MYQRQGSPLRHGSGERRLSSSISVDARNPVYYNSNVEEPSPESIPIFSKRHRDVAVNTDTSNFAALKEVEQSISQLSTNVHQAKQDIREKLEEIQKQEDVTLRDQLVTLYEHVSHRIVGMQKEHEEKIERIRHACRIQLNDEVAKREAKNKAMHDAHLTESLSHHVNEIDELRTRTDAVEYDSRQKDSQILRLRDEISRLTAAATRQHHDNRTLEKSLQDTLSALQKAQDFTLFNQQIAEKQSLIDELEFKLFQSRLHFDTGTTPVSEVTPSVTTEKKPTAEEPTEEETKLRLEVSALTTKCNEQAETILNLKSDYEAKILVYERALTFLHDSLQKKTDSTSHPEASPGTQPNLAVGPARSYKPADMSAERPVKPVP
eukprot:TRINITY_DN33236_c0_g1_i1.p1 TRINITY_DN33236_c0_g1~~TRINITY_DN33236_c0_g1_i1.p1  ORF type:complete len:386 (+),score=57.51 TRINITY_DN33236_c0_g1_i1:26-1159(+)